MSANVVNGVWATSFRPLLNRNMAVVNLRSSSSVASHVNGGKLRIKSSLSTKDYLEQSKELMEFDDGGPPRWFSPLECARRSTGSPLLLFLPGIDGSGLGLMLHHKKLGEIFDIWCLHIPAADRTPLADLVMLVQNIIRTEQDQTRRPIYLVGESFGASLALLVAAHNPNVDLVLILANAATNFSKSLVQSIVPLSNMIHNQLNAGLHFWMSLVPVETVSWKMKMIQEMQNYLNSHLHAVDAQTMILTSGKDMLLTSITEGGRLSSMLPNSHTRSFIGNSNPLFSDDKFDLVAAIKCACYYRRGASVDYIADFLPPSPAELKSACEPLRWMDVAVDPVMLSTMGGKVVRGLAGIPSEGPVLFVSNHMMLGLDLIPLLSRFWIEENIKLRGIAHPEGFGRMKKIKGLEDSPILNVVKMTGGVPVSAKNLYKLFALKSHVLLYPGGAREALHRRGEEHQLIWPDDPEFVRMAARFGAKIVPFGTVGEDDILQLLLDCDDQMKIPPLKALIEELTNETVRLRGDTEGEIGKQFIHYPVVLPKLPGRFYYFFGEPISTEGRKDVLINKEKAKELYLEVKMETEKCIEYLKEKRDKDPYRNLLVRLVYQSYHGFYSQVPTFEI